MVKSCVECSKHARLNCEPMITTPLPEHPWQVVGLDLFHHKGDTYLLVVNYFSRYPEISKLSTTTSQGIINTLHLIFARYGVPEILKVTMNHNTCHKKCQSFLQYIVSNRLPVVLITQRLMDLPKGLCR